MKTKLLAIAAVAGLSCLFLSETAEAGGSCYGPSYGYGRSYGGGGYYHNSGYRNYDRYYGYGYNRDRHHHHHHHDYYRGHSNRGYGYGPSFGVRTPSFGLYIR